MLCGYLEYLEKKKIVLGSKSEGRKRLLRDAGLKFEVVVSDFEEDLDKSGFENTIEYVKATCRGKLGSLRSKVPEGFNLLIVCDTVCSIGGKRVIEKPVDKQDHIQMVTELRDAKVHQVISWVALVFRNEEGKETVKEFAVETDVEFGNIPDKSIEKYLDCHPFNLNSSGGYEMLTSGPSLVKSMRGSTSNVMGLPICDVCEVICEACDHNWI